MHVYIYICFVGTTFSMLGVYSSCSFWTRYFLHKSSSNWRQFSMKSFTVMSLSPTSPDTSEQNHSHELSPTLHVWYQKQPNVSKCCRMVQQSIHRSKCIKMYQHARVPSSTNMSWSFLTFATAESSLSCVLQPAPSGCSNAPSAQQHPRPQHPRP